MDDELDKKYFKIEEEKISPPCRSRAGDIPVAVMADLVS